MHPGELAAKLAQKGRTYNRILLNPDAKKGGGGGRVGDTRRPPYPRKNHPVPITHEVVCVSGLVWMGPECLVSQGFEPRTPKSATSRYTDYAISALVHLQYFYNYASQKKSHRTFSKNIPRQQ